jgi:hypothetical protein
VAVPTILSVSPATGHTGGRTLVEITGTNFRVPDYPPAEGATETPITVRVTFGDEEAEVFGVVDEETLLVLTPSHDESGVPATARNAPIPASDVTVTNLDDDGEAIAGESVTATAAFSFRKPVLDKPTATERVIKELQRQFQRALPRGVELVYDPHTDYDDDTGDALNLVRFAKLPGVGLTGLRTPKSQIAADRADITVEIDDSRSVTRRPAIRRDVILTVIAASDNRDELGRLGLAIEQIFQKLTKVRIPLDEGDASRGYSEYEVIYGAGEVTFGDRQGAANVMAATGELQIFGIEETDLVGAVEDGLTGAPEWLPHGGVVWKITDPTATVAEP